MLLGKLEDTPAAARHAGQRIIRNHHGQAGLFHQQFIHAAQQGAAAGEHDAAFADVRAELGRRLLERLFDRAHDALQRLLQRLQYFIRGQGEAARSAAAMGSGTISTLRAPAPAADSLMARRSTWVEPKGTHTRTRGLGLRNRLPCPFLMKYCSIFSVYVKSAMAPSFIGRTAVICP